MKVSFGSWKFLNLFIQNVYDSICLFPFLIWGTQYRNIPQKEHF